MALATIEELGAYLHTALDEEDLAASIALDAAASVIEDYIGQRILAPETPESVRINGTGDTVLLLPGQPCSVAEVAILEGDDEIVLEDEADYFLDGSAGILYRLDGVWDRGKGNIRVELTVGRAEVPAALKMVSLQVAGRIFDQGLAASETLNGYSITYASDAGVGLTDYERRVLDLYRMRVKTL